MARKILLADDSVTAQNMGRKILVDAGYEVITVNNGSAALKRITESKPDLIVLDVYMPGYSGLEVCQRLKDAAETAHIPVLLTVGKLEPFKPDEARRARADAHIVKPFEASELLSAVARLEDRMVPTDGPRFSTTVSGVERFGADRPRAVPSDPDTGWKSRLRFPSKKKKEEEEVAEEEGANFRDFRKGKGKTGGNSTPADENGAAWGPPNGSQGASAPPPGQEPGLVPDIPRDITPEELDVLSALAAKLDGPIPSAENIASLAEKVGPAASVPMKNDEASEVRAEAHVEKTSGVEASTSEPVKEFELPAAAMATPAQVNTSSENVGGDLKATDAVATGGVTESAIGAPEPTVSAATFIETPAPVDQQDEPMFAVMPAAVSSEETVESKAAEGAVGATTNIPEAEATPKESMVEQSSAQAFAVVGVPPVVEQAKDERATVEQAAVEVAKTDEALEAPSAAQPESVAAEGSIPSQEAAEAEAPAPTDEELAEALRLLTPSTGQPDIVMPSHGTLVAAGQMLAEEAARTAGPNPRWRAEAVALTPQESSQSLEEEMFRSFAAASAAKVNAAPTNPVSAITAVVENRLAEVEKASEREYGTPSSESKAEATTPEVSGEPTVASAVAESGSGEKSAEPPVEESEAPMPSGTFADATLQQEEETTPAASSAESVATESGAVAADEESSFESGGDADMGKHGKEGSSKSGWRQIRKPASTSAASDLVEAAKQSDTDTATEESKAMAAAATGEGGSLAPDASAIASIVDSVLADLRPKIVEEIAKKLGKK